MDVVEGETGNCSGTGVTCDIGDGTEEFSIEGEDAVDVKDEIPEAITFPPVKTEQEVRLWDVCVVMVAHAFRPFMAWKHELQTVQ